MRPHVIPCVASLLAANITTALSRNCSNMSPNDTTWSFHKPSSLSRNCTRAPWNSYCSLVKFTYDVGGPQLLPCTPSWVISMGALGCTPGSLLLDLSTKAPPKLSSCSCSIGWRMQELNWAFGLWVNHTIALTIFRIMLPGRHAPWWNLGTPFAKRTCQNFVYSSTNHVFCAYIVLFQELCNEMTNPLWFTTITWKWN